MSYFWFFFSFLPFLFNFRRGLKGFLYFFFFQISKKVSWNVVESSGIFDMPFRELITGYQQFWTRWKKKKGKRKVVLTRFPYVTHIMVVNIYKLADLQLFIFWFRHYILVLTKRSLTRLTPIFYCSIFSGEYTNCICI